MPKPTKKEIEQAIQELMLAMLEVREASELKDKAELRIIKARKRLLMAREEVRSINLFNN